jgi:A/G-specific adenine glycosylase
MPHSSAHAPIVAWYATHARDLPWRRRDASPWSVLVSEVMLQQTPVNRVLPVYEGWLRRWPTPSALAHDSLGAAVRQWGRLGYPRRAQRLWQAAGVIDSHFDGEVPSTYDELRSLPGVGDYTAAAVATFAYRSRAVVLDTNVRRVLSRMLAGEQFPSRSVTRAERSYADAVVPDAGDDAAVWSVAVMELGALICTARQPRCGECPVKDQCAWRALGHPASAGPPARTQSYDGTDRQCRGSILSLLRSVDAAVAPDALSAVWGDAHQRERALASLIDDGLVIANDDTSVELPTARHHPLAAGRRLGAVRDHEVGGSASSITGASGSSDLTVPTKVNVALAPSPSTSTSTI